MESSWRINRRSLLTGTAGSMAAMIMASAYRLDGFAQETEEKIGLTFFNGHQFETIGAIAEQYWPTNGEIVGARDAGAPIYIDRALAGAYAKYQTLYIAGLEWLDNASRKQYDAEFVGLEADQQFELLTAIFNGEFDTPEEVVSVEGTPMASPVPASSDSEALPEPSLVAGTQRPAVASLSRFMDLVRVHTMEGLFADPVHGGNRDFAGWKAVGYPGPYIVYTAEQQQSFEPLNLPLQSVADF
jgi:gluconate 2-dehydrogenase gamma chain